jgi:hypothetical protein
MISINALMHLHPALQIILAASVLVNAHLILQLRRRWFFYRKAACWPRLTVKAGSVNMLRVVHTDSGATTQQEFYQAVLSFHYQVLGCEYSKQSVRQVESTEAAHELQKNAVISFIYNPENPAQTLDEVPGPAAVSATLIGLLIANGMLLGLAHTLSVFLNGGSN